MPGITTLKGEQLQRKKDAGRNNPASVSKN
jgi:hypothetical protein